MHADLIRFIAVDLGLALLCSIVAYVGASRACRRRMSRQEAELQSLAELLGEALELQNRSHEKLASSLGDVEARMLDLAVPSSEGAHLPLERRHRVLALARKGLPLDEIVRRLDVPRGEAEFILRMRNYLDGKTSGATARDQAQALASSM